MTSQEKKPEVLKLSNDKDDKLVIYGQIGQGGFGTISRCKWKGKELAIKREKKTRKNVSIKVEAIVLKTLAGTPRFPRLYHSGTIGNDYFITMDMLGPNLATVMRRRRRKKFSTITTALIGLQCIEAIELFHSKGFLHRDIKPANFVIGVGREKNKIYLIDFGLTKKINPFEPARPSKTGLGFRGTPRYASINSHRGLELGRVDDLWSVLYMLVEFTKRKLPWNEDKDKNIVYQRKKRFHNERLVKDMPSQYVLFLKGLMSLSFTDQPNYTYFKELLLSILQQRHCPVLAPLDWDPQHPIDLNAESYLDNANTRMAAKNLAELRQTYTEDALPPTPTSVSPSQTARSNDELTLESADDPNSTQTPTTNDADVEDESILDDKGDEEIDLEQEADNKEGDGDDAGGVAEGNSSGGFLETDVFSMTQDDGEGMKGPDSNARHVKAFVVDEVSAKQSPRSVHNAPVPSDSYTTFHHDPSLPFVTTPHNPPSPLRSNSQLPLDPINEREEFGERPEPLNENAVSLLPNTTQTYPPFSPQDPMEEERSRVEEEQRRKKAEEKRKQFEDVSENDELCCSTCTVM
ncbi:putative Tau-tubulin kinase [Blattamonas nauphoetae]|uniref:non-specific serine/threonine protein kinase n=1 Tax=Blattamonas nauphoetae TaxID=2049346 RepID=A0ABQ9Y5R0_9EUKA|nr:putative Tau-tubulin kinase [Blattamonas nauphoetae]